LEPLRPNFRLRQIGQGLFQLAHRANAHLVPVEEALAESAKSLVRLLARHPFAADCVQELLQNRPLNRLTRSLDFLQAVEQVGQQPLFVDRGRHDGLDHPFP
jgi:hypothetical protein